jgi:hypothetical protein
MGPSPQVEKWTGIGPLNFKSLEALRATSSMLRTRTQEAIRQVIEIRERTRAIRDELRARSGGCNVKAPDRPSGATGEC